MIALFDLGVTAVRPILPVVKDLGAAIRDAKKNIRRTAADVIREFISDR